jgi:hypothetical protein
MFTQARLIAAGVTIVALLVGFGSLYLWGNSWRSKFQVLDAQDLAGKLAAQTARADALAKQITDRDVVLKNNAKVLDDLSKQHAAAVASLSSRAELVERLLNNATRVPAPRGSVVPKADSGPITNDAAVDDGNGRLAGLLVRASTEYWNHVEQCAALQAQIGPQLGP